MDEELFGRLSAVDWDQITLNLTDYALRKVRRLRWRTARADALPSGRTVEDLAHDAIAKVWSGERSWDPGTQPDLLHHLKGIVDSLVSHLVESPDHLLVRRFPETGEGTEVVDVFPVADPELGRTEHLAQQPARPDDALLQKEQREADDELFDALLQEIREDQELEAVIGAIMDGATKPADISAGTGIDVKRIYKLREKLDRAVNRAEKRLGRKLGQPRG